MLTKLAYSGLAINPPEPHRPMNPANGYRRDIDGLRALAILPVLAFHTNLPGVTGGFVGVDIFFVISGFLITGIIAREIDRGEFSIARFYERRARRILPALFAMIAFVLAVASWLYLPGDFAGVAPSALMALGFLANVWFFLKTGYFQGGAETMPLLHCWSLGVEEQFYIGFPVLLWLIGRFVPQWRIAVIVAVAAISFALAWLTQAKGDGFAFYLLPPRAWELFAGALLAVGAVPQVNRQALREALSLLGLALIAGSVILYDKHTIFPGVAAIPPVLGSALLIHTAPGTMAGRLLSLPLTVGIGLISYSLYLWHWPLIVFAEYAAGESLSGWRLAAVLAAAFVMATISWRWIERPFRDPVRFDRKRIFVLSGTGMAALGAAAAAMLPLGGWESRFPQRVIQLVRAETDYSPVRDYCIGGPVDAAPPQCVIGAANVPPSALLWSDSHGVELAWALGQEFGRRGEALVERSRGSCPPVLGFDPVEDPSCAPFNRNAMKLAADTPAIRKVYIAAFWASEGYRLPGMIDKIDRTIRELQAAGKQVVIIGPVPPQHHVVPRQLAQTAARGEPTDPYGSTLAEYRARTEWFTANYPRWQAANVTVIDPARALFDGSRSRIVKDGVPLYFDSHHLSVAGAQAVLAADPRR